MLREYQRELNDSVWPEGITLRQEAHFYTTSSYLLTYSFICAQNYNPFNLDLL